MNLTARHYGILPETHMEEGKTTDNTYALLQLFRDVQEQLQNEQEPVMISFETGEYHFYPDYAKEQTLFISNHDEDALKRIVFLLDHLKEVTIHGEDSLFVFHMPELPFYLHECKNVTIEGIMIEYETPVYSEATILEVEKKRVLLHIDTEKYPIEIQNGVAFFERDGECNTIYCWLEIDKERCAPVYDIHDMWFGFNEKKNTPTNWKKLENNTFEVTLLDEEASFPEQSRAGNIVILRHHLRSHPAIYVTDCEDITIQDVKIHHAAGMGVIAERTRNITLNRVFVVRNPNKKRIYTAAADATHFVLCDGLIHLNECCFENQLDDPINVHGIYTRIKEVRGNQLLVQLVHSQHLGVCIGKPGQKVQLIRKDYMTPYHTATIKSIEPINKEYILVELSAGCDLTKEGDCLENISYVPEVHIEHCTFRNNRARGALLTSAGRVLVEHNEFMLPGAAILMEGDAANWFESGETKEIIVRNNRFCNCAYVSDWGKAPIQVTPSVKQIEGNIRYHKKLVVEDNVFEVFDQRLLYAENIDQIYWKNNQVIQTNEYQAMEGEPFVLKNVNEFIE